MNSILCEKCKSPILTEWRKDKKYIKLSPSRFCSRACANSKTPSNEQKQALSVKMKSKVREPRPLKYGIIECPNCHISFTKRYPSTKFCSNNCWKSYHKSSRTLREEYKRQCQFQFNVYDYPEYFNLELLTQHGWYSPVNKNNNLNGVSRDHRLSIADGFEQNINPDIISHPVNCKLVCHRDNQIKHRKSTVSLEELSEEIRIFNLTYKYKESIFL